MLNAIYGYKGTKTFTSKIIKNNDSYNFIVEDFDGKKMENIIILYSCGKKLEDLIRPKNEKTPNSKKYINDFSITNIYFCTQEDHINQLNIPYYKNQFNSYHTNIDSIYNKFLKE